MRTVKVRILPPQPIFPSRNAGIGGVGCFYTDCPTLISRPISCFQPETKYQLREETVMGWKAKATLWMVVKIRGRSVMKRMVKKGRSYVPKIEGPYEPGYYHLRYAQNRKRMWEPVGNDLTLALQEHRARQRALETLRILTLDAFGRSL